MMPASDGIHSVEKINDETYRIDENGVANSYLLLGSDAALLIDCGVGLGNIRQTVEELSALPVTLALTHRHCDHAGGRNFFTKYCVHKGDRGLIYAFTASDAASKMLLKGGGMDGLTLSKKPCHAKAEYFDDSRRFELGGRTVRVKNVPGHTEGSVVFIDDKYHLMFTGDDVNPYLWMQLPGCTTLSRWLGGAREILELADTYTPYAGHDSGRLSRDGIAGIIQVVEKLLEERLELHGQQMDYPGADAPLHVLVTKNRIR